MAFKLLVLVASLAAANAGLIGQPLAYSSAPAVSHVSYASPVVSYGAPSVAVHAPTITSQSQNIYRTAGNLGQISAYSKTIDTPFSSVRKSDVRVTNPAITTYAAAPVAYAAPALHAAPVAYAAPAVHAAPVAYAAPALHAAPLAYSAPVVKTATTAVSGGLLGVAYSAAPAVAHMTYSNGLGVSYAW